MKLFRRYSLILIAFVLGLTGLIALIKKDYAAGIAFLLSALCIGFTGPQVHQNTGHSLGYQTPSEINIGRIFATIRMLMGMLFLAGSIGAFFNKELTIGIIVFVLGASLFSPLSSLFFYQSGYLLKSPADYRIVKKYCTWFVIARNAGVLFLFVAMGLYDSEKQYTAGILFFYSGIVLLFTIPFLLLIKKDLLVTSPSLAGLLAGETSTSVPAPPAVTVQQSVAFSQAVSEDKIQETIHQEEKQLEESNHLLHQFEQLQFLPAQKRGYEFQNFLINFFNENQLNARSAFRIVGEEIDGSIEVEGNIYLLEAKWQQPLCSGRELRDFNGKVEGKANWARGIIVCYSGFSEEAISGFVTGKRLNIIGMDGKDIRLILERKYSLHEVIRKKARLAVEKNSFFVPVEKLD